MLEGCVIADNHQLPEFAYNGKAHNSRIITRRPDYGDGHPDGCIVMDEMQLRMNVISPDSVSFEVKDVGTQQPVMATIMLVYQTPAKIDTLLTNIAGGVSAKRSADLKRVEAASLGYRQLTVDLTRLK
ncbi:hypothetical protein [Hymenobacter convexus]|uniref:hypothetical protein n=1 Tax=Hymenobacter sp. CA1UV-4 TaxID=3063782 RepID=UPI002712BA93|nr:hypothetical protein [Hymenobacter sp. CA1UV-4]MDO7852344.1 hypothetical protein [Hymenobacter sp. CA1UV-4]